MANYYKTEDDLTINKPGGHVTALAGSYILAEVDGTLSFCSDSELQANMDRIDGEQALYNALVSEAQSVMDMITALNTESATFADEVLAARTAYEALSVTQKGWINNYSTLVEMEQYEPPVEG
jgi:hypothetical protein